MSFSASIAPKTSVHRMLAPLDPESGAVQFEFPTIGCRLLCDVLMLSTFSPCRSRDQDTWRLRPGPDLENPPDNRRLLPQYHVLFSVSHRILPMLLSNVRPIFLKTYRGSLLYDLSPRVLEVVETTSMDSARSFVISNFIAVDCWTRW